MHDINHKSIKDFLDAVDTVLNSNTFLLSYKPSSLEDPKYGLANYLRSVEFRDQLIKQDLERNWYNMHVFDNETESYKPKPGEIVKSDIDLKISNPPVDKREYLIAMLTADQKVANFVSPYGDQKNKAEANQIVDSLLNYITNGNDWGLYTVFPDFLYNEVERYESQSEEQMRYFEGDYACDSATLITTKNEHFLLLTNGID